MKKLFIISSIAIGTVFLAQCTPKASKAVTTTSNTTTKGITTNTATTATSVMTREEANANFSADQLETGKVLFTGNCAKCHGMKAPETRTPEQWEKVLQRMIPKAKLSEEDGKLVKAYVIAHSKQG